MHPILRNILAVVAGIIVGMIVNMGLVMMGSALVPLNIQVDPNDMDAFAKAMENAELKHYIFPFLAHALGTLAGAITAAAIAANRKIIFALVIGCFFLAGGIMVNIQIPSPMWFHILDIVVAYIPMGYLGGKMMTRRLK
jgi:hypothetical protein